MVAVSMLQSPSIRDWLGDVVPVWTMLDQASLDALRKPPASRGAAIRLARDLTPDEVSQSAIACNASILLRAAAVMPGLKLTATGNLSRQVVGKMCNLLAWPGYDREETFRLHKVVNEPDFLPLFLVRHLAEVSGLIKKRQDRVATTSAGTRALASPGRDSLQALLFHSAFWRADLSYLSRGLLRGWPQQDAGIVLWSLSAAANDWTSPNRLARLCTVPIDGILNQQFDAAGYAIEGIMLRPLNAFGLLEHRADPIPNQRFAKTHLYRKSPLFDRFLNFEVKIESNDGIRH